MTTYLQNVLQYTNKVLPCSGTVPGRICSVPPNTVPSTELHLQHLEALHRVYDLYIWLAYRFEDAYPDRELIEDWRKQCSQTIREGLDNLSNKAEGKKWWDLQLYVQVFQPFFQD